MGMYRKIYVDIEGAGGEFPNHFVYLKMPCFG